MGKRASCLQLKTLLSLPVSTESKSESSEKNKCTIGGIWIKSTREFFDYSWKLFSKSEIMS